MILFDFSYLTLPELTGDIKADTYSFLSANEKEKTFAHSKAVAETAVKIAEIYNLSTEICEASAYLHDISAVINPDNMLAYIKESNLFLDEAEKRYPFILHQRISKIIAENHFGVTDKDILSAIECHTTLKKNPSPYDMALFIADKLSWDQDGKPPFYDIVSESLHESLEKASLAYIDYIIENKIILYPHSWLTEGRNYLKTII